MRSEPELVALRKLAEDLAKGRGERASTAHLLAAIAKTPGSASDVLRERRLEPDVLLQAARVAVDDAPDAIARAVQRAREFAARCPAGQHDRAKGSATPEPAGPHLLFALCHERGFAAFRAIEQCGTDVVKLRTAAMQLAMGIVGARRPVQAAPAPAPRTTRAQGALPQAAPPKVPPRAAPAPPAAARPAPAQPRPAPPAVTAIPTPERPRKARPAHRHGGERTASRFALDPRRFPALCAAGRNLTEAAERGELDPVVGRDAEIERALDVLAKRHANSPCLVGAAGVGKTSVVRGLAQRIASGKDVASLDDRVVIEIDAASLLVGTGTRGALAERLAQVRAEVLQGEGRVVVFFDEVHVLFGPDAGDEAQAELKGALAKGELPCIGATTHDEYRRFIASDPALARRFTSIEVGELSAEEAMLAIEGVAPVFERHHGARYTPEALACSVVWSSRYVPERALPDKAIAILDLAGARARRRGAREVCREQVAEVVADLATVPLERLLETDADRMLRMEELLARRIVGHRAALARIATVLRRNASGFRSRRPIGSFLLLGPTGVGKTETAKAVAECLFHSPHAMTRLDLSEFAEPHAIARLVGAPPGYVGFEAGGHLTEAVRRRPYQVVLLDEIEKAHRDVLEAFLQVFDEGHLTDGRGRTVDFSNTVIFLTSNLGAEVSPARARGRIGFGPAAARDLGEYEIAMTSAARSALPPELYNRLDEVLAFGALGRAEVGEVARRMLAALGEDLERARGVKLDVSEEAIEALLSSGGYDPTLGARPMRRAIGRLVEAPIAEMILRGELTRGDVAMAFAEDGKVVVDAFTPRPAASA